MAYAGLEADITEFNLLRGEIQEELEGTVRAWLQLVATQVGQPGSSQFRLRADADPARPRALRVHGFVLTAAHWEYSSRPSSLFHVYSVKVRYMVDRIPEYINVETTYKEIRLFKFN